MQQIYINVSISLFVIKNNKLHILLINRSREPFLGKWILPGGYIDNQENCETTIRRKLFMKTGLTDIHFEQFGVFSDPTRDPRYRAINIGYISLLHDLEHLKLFSEYGEVSLHEINHLPEMAFDHYTIVKSAYQYLRDKVEHFALIGEFLSKEFTLTELQHVYEILMLSTTDGPNFRKKALASGNLKATGHFQITGRTRPAQLYRFVKA